MFNKTVTFYHKTPDEVYSILVVHGVYVQLQKGYDRQGQRPVDEIRIIIPQTVSVCPGDIVVFGEGIPILRANELGTYKLVSSVDDYGQLQSGLAHIEVIAR